MCGNIGLAFTTSRHSYTPILKFVLPLAASTCTEALLLQQLVFPGNEFRAISLHIKNKHSPSLSSNSHPPQWVYLYLFVYFPLLTPLLCVGPFPLFSQAAIYKD